mgnify:CR=1 FL=1
MLRNLLIAAIFLLGFVQSLRGPYYALLFYLWIAYFRPESWVWSDWVASLNLSFFVGLAVVGLTVIRGSQVRWRFGW